MNLLERKKISTREKGSTPNTATILLFWNNMADVTSCKNAILAAQHAAVSQALVFRLYTSKQEPNARIIRQLDRAILRRNISVR